MRIGCDILQVDRVLPLIDKANRVFSECEIEYAMKFKNHEEHFAGFFCAKEAFIKAIDLPLKDRFPLSDISVCHKDNGRPYIKLLGKAKEIIGDIDCDLSISHSKEVAMATVVLISVDCEK